MRSSGTPLTFAVILAGILYGAANLVRADEPAAPDSPLTFERQIRPIFKAHCFQCHGEGGELKGGLDLRLRRLIVQGGDSGEALVPGKQDESLLFERIRDGEMPPGEKKLPAADIALIGRWIAQGAHTNGPEPADVAALAEITPEERQFWSFQPIQNPALPAVKHVEQVRTPIDAFLLARLEEKGLAFADEADKRTLLRRASFDLLGLPPTPEDVARFLADDAPDAYERLVDRLLSSPQYGERWGRHWLDVAGYADSDGYTPEDPVRPYAYKYRDYVVHSINADKPFDQFIQEQLAGDEMVPQPYQNLTPENLEKLVATGFLRTAADGTGSGGVDQKVARNQVIADTIRIVSTSLLGLSVGCAQCHNHRYDPILQSDYYRMRAVFEPAYNGQNWRAPRARLISLYTDADREQSRQIEAEAAKIDAERLKKQAEYIEQTFQKELAKLPEELREPIREARSAPADKRTPEQQKLLKEHPSVNVTAGSLYLYDHKAAEDLKKEAARAAEVRATKPVEDFISPLTEIPGQVPETFLFHRGDPDQPKQALPPGDLTILDQNGSCEIAAKDPALPTSGRRLAYARHLTDGKHPLTARVLVNRVWMNHFGRGIVATPADFGVLGARPTHAELLDWLATDFMAGGWRLKRLHKLMMTSTAYRQTSRRQPSQDAADPDNTLYGRMSVRRLEAEDVRDSVLAVSGKLNDKMYGKPVPVIEDEVGQFVLGIENLNGENRPGPVIPLNGEEFRRSLYVQARRSRPLAVLDTFDLPVMEPNCEIRASSTVTPQSLMLMNSEFVVQQSEHFASRLAHEAGGDSRSQVSRAWQLAFGREASEAELTEAVGFVTELAEQYRQQAAAAPPPQAKAPAAPPDPQLRALSTFCQALFSANEFLYVE